MAVLIAGCILSVFRISFRLGFLRQEDGDMLAAEIIESAAKEKERINDAITNAETSLAVALRRGRH
ncbi:MAG TPA: hypothetical protein VN087_19755 [Verrucomicrobiae bacterium]|jgi:hypothetical protein|nr:hypothetical protein [Verrucomicrobiae bacterium]